MQITPNPDTNVVRCQSQHTRENASIGAAALLLGGPAFMVWFAATGSESMRTAGVFVLAGLWFVSRFPAFGTLEVGDRTVVTYGSTRQVFPPDDVESVGTIVYIKGSVGVYPVLSWRSGGRKILRAFSGSIRQGSESRAAVDRVVADIASRLRPPPPAPSGP